MTIIEQVPGVIDIVTTRDDDYRLNLQWKTANVPMDLTGYTFAAYLKAGTNSLAASIITTGLASGQVSAIFHRAQLASLADGIYTWHMTWNTPDTQSRRVLYGFFTLKTVRA